MKGGNFKLPLLYKIANADAAMTEHVYKFTEMYLPTDEDQNHRQSMLQYLDYQVRGQVAQPTLMEQEGLWKRKREIKEM